MTVAIHVREVDGHAGVAGFTDGERGREPEISVSVVEPELIGVLEIVADIEVGRAVAVHVVESGGEREVIRLLGKRLSVFATKAWTGDRRAREMAVPVIQEKQIRFRALRPHDAAELRAILDAKLRGPLWIDRILFADLVHHLLEGARLGRIGIERIARLVRRGVEIEIAVAIHVGKSQPRHSIAAHEATPLGRIREASVTIAEPELQRSA